MSIYIYISVISATVCVSMGTSYWPQCPGCMVYIAIYVVHDSSFYITIVCLYIY